MDTLRCLCLCTLVTFALGAGTFHPSSMCVKCFHGRTLTKANTVACLVPTVLQRQPGEDAILLCWTTLGCRIAMLEWFISGTTPQHGNYVLLYRNDRAYDAYQKESYKTRVQLQDPNLQHGNVGVILKNLTVSDTGVYVCLITYNCGSQSLEETPEIQSTVSLTVQYNSVEEHPTVQYNSVGETQTPHIALLTVVGLTTLLSV